MTPAEIAEDYRDEGLQIRRSCLLYLPWSSETVYLKTSPKGGDQSMNPTHHQGEVENATASSAGGSPDSDEKA